MIAVDEGARGRAQVIDLGKEEDPGVGPKQLEEPVKSLERSQAGENKKKPLDLATMDDRPHHEGTDQHIGQELQRGPQGVVRHERKGGRRRPCVPRREFRPQHRRMGRQQGGQGPRQREHLENQQAGQAGQKTARPDQPGGQAGVERRAAGSKKIDPGQKEDGQLDGQNRPSIDGGGRKRGQDKQADEADLDHRRTVPGDERRARRRGGRLRRLGRLGSGRSAVAGPQPALVVPHDFVRPRDSFSAASPAPLS